ncbi:MAG: type II secretion system F family protein [Acidimicrobiales bacterium]
MTLLAAGLAGVCVWLLARRLTSLHVGPGGPLGAGRVGIRPRLGWSAPAASWGALRGAGSKNGRPGFQVWLSQAGAAVTPGQFWSVSAGVGAVTFVLLLAISRTPVVAGLPALAAGAAPYAYWSGQRRKQAQARSAAWPDALRYLVGVLGAGMATLHEALEELSRSGPEPLRAPMGRYARMAGRVGQRQALEAVRAGLADPVSDPVLLALAGAVEEGTETVLRVLADLGSQITADIQLAEKVRTLQTQSRAATWGCFSLPYVVLLFLCATNDAYRHFFSEPVGLVLVLGGGLLSAAGLAVCRRLVRPIATTGRVFSTEGVPWAR